MTWPLERLNDVAELCLGKMLDRQKNRGTLRPYLRNINVRWGTFDLSDIQEMPFEDHELERYSVRTGDVVICEGGEPGRCAVWTSSAPFFIQKALHRVRCGPKLFPEFLSYWLRHLAISGRLARHFTGSTIHHLPGIALGSLTVPCPPAWEQAHVVAVIDAQFSRIEAVEATLWRARDNVKRARASVLKAAVEGRLVPTEAALARTEGRDYEPASTLLTRILTERRARWTASSAKAKYVEPVAPDSELTLPEGWVCASCDQVGDIMLGRQKAPQYLTGKYNTPYLRVANIKDDRIDLSDVDQMDFDDAHLEKYRLRPGDILVSEGQSPELVGQSAVYRGGWEKLCFQKALHRFRPLDSGPSTEFAQIVFRAWVRGRVFMRRASITTNIAHLTLEKFKASPFPLPPLAEQRRIIAEVDRRLSVLDALDATLDANLARCARLRQSILKRAFEGKLVRPDAAAPKAPQLPLFTEEVAP